MIPLPRRSAVCSQMGSPSITVNCFYPFQTISEPLRREPITRTPSADTSTCLLTGAIYMKKNTTDHHSGFVHTMGRPMVWDRRFIFIRTVLGKISEQEFPSLPARRKTPLLRSWSPDLLRRSSSIPSPWNGTNRLSGIVHTSFWSTVGEAW